VKDALAEDAAGEEPEPEDKNISYADYLAQQAEKKLGLESLNIRGANEGSKLDKKWANATALEKDEDEDFIAGSAGKKQRERERKTKQTIDFDPRFVEPERGARGGARGGRGGARGDRGDRGGARGDRGDRGGPRGGRGGERGGAARGGERGERGGPRGGFRGGRGGGPREGGAAPINTKDESAFPTLGK
jgi:plasminogen activator inhibitor 1 RNA-binding protein